MPARIFQQTANHIRLYLAAGCAAERIRFVKEDFAAAQEDIRIFGNPLDTTFEAKVNEAKGLLLNQKELIERLASRLYEIFTNARGDFSSFREQRAGSGSEIHYYWVLLDEEELKFELRELGALW